MPMQTRLLSLSAVVLMVCACSKEPDVTPTTSADTATLGTASPASSQASDASLPSATSVFAAEAPASAASAGATATIQPNATLTDAQEKTGMPLGGQTDNHSAPKATDKPASAQ